MNDASRLSFTFDQRTISTAHVGSLVWADDKLVDWVGGGVVYELDGTRSSPRVVYPYRFDAATVSPSGAYVALYERLGTKAVLQGPDGLFRELNRSYYHADVYEYPILFLRLADGREVLAHCPSDYCDLEIEDPTTGARLSEEGSGRVPSLFHSRLVANEEGSRLLSVGWAWHPFDTVQVYDLKPTENGRILLDRNDGCWDQGAEVSSAAFNDAGHLILTSSKGAQDYSDDEADNRLRPGMIGVFDLDRKSAVSLATLDDEAGTILPIGTDHVIGFFDHPKLIDVTSGRVLHRWPDLKTGEQSSSIIHHIPLPPAIALDHRRARFTVAGEDHITVVTLSPD